MKLVCRNAINLFNNKHLIQLNGEHFHVNFICLLHFLHFSQKQVEQLKKELDEFKKRSESQHIQTQTDEE